MLRNETLLIRSDNVFFKTFDARPTGGLEVTAMQGQVAVAAQRDQVLFGISGRSGYEIVL